MEIVWAIARFFMNPIVYIAIVMALFIGYQRVKRERRQFHRRLLWGGSEVMGMWRHGLALGAIISVMSAAFGMTVPVQWVLLVAVCMLIGLLSFTYTFGSAMYAFAAAFALLWLVTKMDWSFTLFSYTFEGLNVWGGTVVCVTLFAAMFLIAEGMLIRTHAAKFASPVLTKTKRGLRGIAYKTKQFWLLPLFLIVPGDAVTAFFPYWPQFSLGHKEFAFLFFPVVIGFEQATRQTLPQYVYPQVGKRVTLLGELVLVLGLATLFFPQLGVIGLIIGVAGRLFITWHTARQQDGKSYAVQPKKEGVVIAGVLADSPAEKMGLVVGECIRRVNGQSVHTEDELYKALQINAAYCKLEVLDHQNEVRLTQHAIFVEDHYRIGLLLV